MATALTPIDTSGEADTKQPPAAVATAVRRSVGDGWGAVHLHGVSWQTYQALLADLGDASGPRLTYDRGVLRIMSPGPQHEKCNRALSLLVELLAEELDLEVENFGSSTFKREDLKRGFEPDTCFYIGNAARVTGKLVIDLSADPPPDLVIEVDITSSGSDKLPLFAALGVPEVWRFCGRHVSIYKLSGRSYGDSDTSIAFPMLTSETLGGLARRGVVGGRRDFVRAVRAWVREQRASGPA